MRQEDHKKTYLDSLYGLWEYLDRLNDDLQEAVEAAYEEREVKPHDKG